MLKKLFINLSQLSQGKWWIEVIATHPLCTYYFGPFNNAQEAEAMRPGYLQDLYGEGVHSLQVCIKRCQPTRLTIFDDDDSAPEMSALRSAGPLGIEPVKHREHMVPPWQNHQNV